MSSISGLHICCEQNGNRIGEWSLQAVPGSQYTFGRAAGNQIVLAADTISSNHGLFYRDEHSWYIYDNNSTNGTFVDGQRIFSVTPITTGNSVTLGSGAGAVSILLSAEQGAYSGADATAYSKGFERTGSSISKTRSIPGGRLDLLIFDGQNAARRVELDCTKDRVYTFGRNSDNSIVLTSPYAAREHGMIAVRSGHIYIVDRNSTNGLIVNGLQIGGRYGNYPEREISVGDTVRIDTENPAERGINGVLMAAAKSGASWAEKEIQPGCRISIGREQGNDICLSHVGVSRRHAVVECDYDGKLYITDTSTNGTFVDGMPVQGRMFLPDRSCISITTATLYVSGNRILYTVATAGLKIEARHLTRDVKDGGRTKCILNDVNLNIEPGEFVAIVGGSGCGKSTLLNAITGYDRATGGDVVVGGESLYPNYDYFKSLLGYVPQQDIVYNYIELRKMLDYAARLRMPSDTSEQERKARVEEVLKTVELENFAQTMVHKLSGGQKKRASIAVELLADPSLFFLDEPTSGLDPGTERNLMYTLRALSQDKQKTVVMVTHTTLNLHLCDKIIFMGKGGRLCYCGSPDGALSFFGVDNFVDIYNLISEDTPGIADRFAAQSGNPDAYEPPQHKEHRLKRAPLLKQIRVLSSRYLTLICNDRARLLLLLLEPLLLGVILKICASDDVFEVYLDTKNMLFTFSCCAIWIGIFNSIQEICKERVILKREYMANLRLDAYIWSKFLIQALLCLIQTVIIFVTFSLLVGTPETGYVSDNPAPEMMLSTYLAILASSCMGLVVSALSKNPDRAMTLSPFLLVFQLVFAGIIFKLDGAVKSVSYLTISRWNISSLGISSGLYDMYDSVREQNELVASMTGKEVVEDASLSLFEQTDENLLTAWLILLGFCIVFCVISALCLKRVKKDSR